VIGVSRAIVNTSEPQRREGIVSDSAIGHAINCLHEANYPKAAKGLQEEIERLRGQIEDRDTTIDEAVVETDKLRVALRESSERLVVAAQMLAETEQQRAEACAREEEMFQQLAEARAALAEVTAGWRRGEELRRTIQMEWDGTVLLDEDIDRMSVTLSREWLERATAAGGDRE
jgi:chromosome segregation ATPase